MNLSSIGELSYGDNCKLLKKISSLNTLSENLNSELQSTTESHCQWLYSQLHMLHKQIIQSIKSLPSRNLRSVLNLVEHVYDSPVDFSASLYESSLK